MPDVESKWEAPAWGSGALASEFEPLPRIGVFQAARRHWLLVLLPILVLVPVAAVLAARRTPTYSAEARMVVGQLNISTPGAIAGLCPSCSGSCCYLSASGLHERSRQPGRAQVAYVAW